MDEIRSIRSRKDFLRMGRDFMIFYYALERGQRALLKDPFAVFSVPWFAQKLNCKVVITVRHPAAFASSLQRLNWNFDFKDLLEQPLLIRDYLEAYREQMSAIKADDVIGQAALLWKMIYHSVHTTRSLNPDIQVLRHEDFSRDPLNKYRDLYAMLGLSFTSRVQKTILNSSGNDNAADLSLKKTHSVKLDSAANIKNWKKRLSAEDLKRIRNMTEGVANTYYSNEEWE